MITLKGATIYLRALEPNDLEFVYAVENDELVWEVSHTQTPYSRFLIRQYLENANQDIYEAKQLRLAICNLDNDAAIGLIDIFDFDPKNNRAGIGILIKDIENRSQGVGTEALDLLIKYTFTFFRYVINKLLIAVVVKIKIAELNTIFLSNSVNSTFLNGLKRNNKKPEIYILT